MNVMNAMKPDTAQGRKYGSSRKNCIRPKVLGHRAAELKRTPPIMGLESYQFSIDELGKPVPPRQLLDQCSTSQPHKHRCLRYWKDRSTGLENLRYGKAEFIGV